jgi:hypothetical protein
MPDKWTLKRVSKDRRQGKSAGTQASEFVRQEIDHIGSQAWRVRASESTRDRALTSTIGTTKYTSQKRSVPVGDVDAHVLHQSRRKKFIEALHRHT